MVLNADFRANNFMAWVKGPDVDYDDWAELVGDPWWRWANVKQELNKVTMDELSSMQRQHG